MSEPKLMSEEERREIGEAIVVEGWLRVPDSPTAATATNSARDRRVAGWLRKCVAHIDGLTAEKREAAGRLRYCKAHRTIGVVGTDEKFDCCQRAERDRLTADVDRLRKDNVSAWHKADTVERVKGEEVAALEAQLKNEWAGWNILLDKHNAEDKRQRAERDRLRGALKEIETNTFILPDAVAIAHAALKEKEGEAQEGAYVPGVRKESTTG